MSSTLRHQHTRGSRQVTSRAVRLENTKLQLCLLFPARCPDKQFLPVGEWHLYKPSDSLGDKLCHQSECSYHVHLQPVPPEPCQHSPTPKYMQLGSQPHILGSAQFCTVGGQKGKQRSYGKAEKTGRPKAARKSPSFSRHIAALQPGVILQWSIALLVFPNPTCFLMLPIPSYLLLSLPRTFSLLVYTTNACSLTKSDLLIHAFS